jgi:phospholipid/cholesterol/gamma-HCH transport system substrate-binding protein
MGERRMSPVGRIAAVAAIGLAVLATALLLLGGDDYHVRARFESAAGMVKGNVVQIAGKPVGVVSGIHLSDDGQAELDLKIDGRYAPLRRWTQVALRLASLSSPAGR